MRVITKFHKVTAKKKKITRTASAPTLFHKVSATDFNSFYKSNHNAKHKVYFPLVCKT